MEPSWDVPRLFKDLGGPTQILAWLNDNSVTVDGRTPQMATVKMWYTRRAIPSTWLSAILQIGLDKAVLSPDGIISYMGDQDRPEPDPFA